MGKKKKPSGKKKKVVAAVALLFSVLALGTVPAWAQAPDPPAFAFPGLNLNGDLFYFVRTGTFGAGPTFTLATLYGGLGEVKVAYVKPVNAGTEPDRYGAGIGVNLPKLVERAGGEWIARGINSSIGIMGLVPVGGGAGATSPAIDWALYLTVLQLKF